jgi:hypothetical protein
MRGESEMDDKLKGLLKKSFDVGYEKGVAESRIGLDEIIASYEKLKKEIGLQRLELDEEILKLEKKELERKEENHKYRIKLQEVYNRLSKQNDNALIISIEEYKNKIKELDELLNS